MYAKPSVRPTRDLDDFRSCHAGGIDHTRWPYYNNAMWSNRQVREWLEGSSSSSSDEEDYDVTKNVAVSELNRMKRKFLEGNVDSSSSSSGWPDDDDEADRLVPLSP